MAQAKPGDTVKVHYNGSLEDGTIFDSSLGKEPLTFTLGQGMVIPGFENAVLGMNEGETKTVTIPPEEAYGPYDEDLVVTIERAQIPPHIAPEIGMVLQVTSQDGRVSNVTVTEMTEKTVTLDGNSPLAGKNLTFEIKLESII